MIIQNKIVIFYKLHPSLLSKVQILLTKQSLTSHDRWTFQSCSIERISHLECKYYRS
jgi:hypothetical protein